MPAPLRLNLPPSEGKQIDASKIRGNLSTSPSVIYLEDGARAMERKESHSLRKALAEVDIQEEQRLYEAAQAEASKLVMEHSNPTFKSKDTGYANPDLSESKRSIVFHEANNQLDSSLHTPSGRDRTKSTRSVTFREPSPESMSPPPTSNHGSTVPVASRKKSYQGLANAVAADIANIKRRVSSGGKRIVSGGKRKASDKFSFPNPDDKIFEEAEPFPDGASTSTDSLQKPPPPSEAVSIADMPRHMRKNPFARVRFNKDHLERANSIASTSSTQSVKFNPVEIQKNPPTQSRKPWYMSNNPARPPPSSSEPIYVDLENKANSKQELNLEVRSDDIRAATSVKRKDRNPDLPQPTAVSDSPGRPIVSFQNEWKSSEVAREQNRPSSRDQAVPKALAPRGVSSSKPADSTKDIIAAARRRAELAIARGTVEEPVKQRPANLSNSIPILNLPGDDDGTLSKTLSEDPSVPQLNILQCDTEPQPTAAADSPSQSRPIGKHHMHSNHDQSGHSESRALPRPLAPQPRRSDTQRSARSDASNGTRTNHVAKRSAALCAHCALPISGRILTAAGERFHPDCFTCHQCGINLECVAFYPEPDQKYYERIARIQQRMQGFEVASPECVTEEDVKRLEQADGDESMRFFCHLDFHELFSPRCRSCKTPIEGEVVVACGAEWHVGHFFCAQCGDVSRPMNSGC